MFWLTRIILKTLNIAFGTAKYFCLLFRFKLFTFLFLVCIFSTSDMTCEYHTLLSIFYEWYAMWIPHPTVYFVWVICHVNTTPYCLFSMSDMPCEYHTLLSIFYEWYSMWITPYCLFSMSDMPCEYHTLLSILYEWYAMWIPHPTVYFVSHINWSRSASYAQVHVVLYECMLNKLLCNNGWLSIQINLWQMPLGSLVSILCQRYNSINQLYEHIYFIYTRRWNVHPIKHNLYVHYDSACAYV